MKAAREPALLDVPTLPWALGSSSPPDFSKTRWGPVVFQEREREREAGGKGGERSLLTSDAAAITDCGRLGGFYGVFISNVLVKPAELACLILLSKSFFLVLF